MQNRPTTISTSEENDLSSSDDDADPFNHITSHNPSPTNRPAGDSNSSTRVFGIARRTSSSAHQILCNNIVGLSGAQEPLGSTNGKTTREPSPTPTGTLLSSTTSAGMPLQNKQLDRSRWMSPPNTNPHIASTTSPIVLNNNINGQHSNHVQSRAQNQPFQGLFAQLKRTTSIDSPCEPVPTKRLC